MWKKEAMNFIVLTTAEAEIQILDERFRTWRITNILNNTASVAVNIKNNNKENPPSGVSLPQEEPQANFEEKRTLAIVIEFRSVRTEFQVPIP